MDTKFIDKNAEVKRLIREIIGTIPGLPVRGTVTAIDGQTCKVKLVSGLEVSGVRLKATVDNGSDYLVITPKIGTDVLMLSGNGTLDDLTVIKTDRAEKIELSQGGLVILADSSDSKVMIKNQNASLVEIMSDMAELLKQLKVSTPMGPSGTPLPDTITALEQWELKFKKLLK